MKRTFFLLLSLAILVQGIPSCMKSAADMSAADAPLSDDADFQISGFVLDKEDAGPLEGIRVSLVSYLPSDALREKPVSRASVYSDEKGIYVIRKRFNAPVYALTHTLEFVDENAEDGLYQSFTMDVAIPQASVTHSAQGGYILDEVNAFLSLTQ